MEHLWVIVDEHEFTWQGAIFLKIVLSATFSSDMRQQLRADIKYKQWTQFCGP